MTRRGKARNRLTQRRVFSHFLPARASGYADLRSFYAKYAPRIPPRANTVRVIHICIYIYATLQTAMSLLFLRILMMARTLSVLVSDARVIIINNRTSFARGAISSPNRLSRGPTRAFTHARARTHTYTHTYIHTHTHAHTSEHSRTQITV